LLLIAVLVVPSVRAQYYNERVLEKSFEQADFFFQPSFLNPFGLGGFGRSAPGLIDDPLLDLQLSPALLTLDSLGNNYLYLDFRSNRDVEQEATYPVYYDRGFVDSYYPYPTYYANTRQEVEPVFSGAYLFRPLGRRVPGLALGLSYQAIFRDEGYYAIPTDIYRSSPGYDFAGDRAAQADVPIEDIYLGNDDMRQVGHFFALNGSYALNPRLRLGFRAAGVLFDREGESGDQSRWRGNYGAETNSYWSNYEGRNQGYDHWDFSGGLAYQVTERVQAGFAAGYLSGTANQDLARDDSSRYTSGTVNQGTEWNYYVQGGSGNQRWDHTGGTLYGSAYLQARLNERQRLTAYYRFMREDVDLAMEASVRDTSFSDSRSEYDDWVYIWKSVSTVRDDRQGAGTRSGFTHRVAGAMQWRLDDKTQLSLGANLQVDRRRTETTEDVTASLYRSYDNIWNDGEYHVVEGRDEVKTLLWDFETRVTSIQIPVLVSRRFGEAFEVMFGINRRMSASRITDETLALFDYRIITQDGITTRRDDFGERYREPTERRTDVQTTLLGGLVVSPTPNFDMRLLVMPNISESYGHTKIRRYQWWIGFNVTP